MDAPLHHAPCVPRLPPSDKFHVFHFHPARIDYLAVDGRPAYGINASFPPVEVALAGEPRCRGLPAQDEPPQLALRDHTGRVARRTASSPSLLFWLAVGLGGAFLLRGAAWFAYRLVSRRASAARGSVRVDPGTPLERALAVLRYAHETGDETLQRKAFERVAGELGVERADELT